MSYRLLSLVYLVALTCSATMVSAGELSTGLGPAVTTPLEAFRETHRALPLPDIGARSSAATERLGDRIYYVGGHVGPQHSYPPASYSGRLDVFDVATSAWQEGASRPLAAQGYSIVAHGKYLYAFGGFAYSASHDPKYHSVDTIDRYDTTASRWERLRVKLPSPRSSYAVGKVGNKAYFLGGWDSTPKTAGDKDGKFTDQIDVFDFDKETVSTLSVKLDGPLRRTSCAVVVDGEIIVVGGLGPGGHSDLLDDVRAFNPQGNTWRTLAPLTKGYVALFAPGCGLLGHTVFVFGGLPPNATQYTNKIYALDLAASASWVEVPQTLREGKSFVQVVQIDSNSLGLLGGHTGDVMSANHPVATFESFVP